MFHCSCWTFFELYNEAQSNLWKPVSNIYPVVNKQALHTIQPGTSDDILNICGSPNDLFSEDRSPVTSSILFRDSQYFRAERELGVQFWTCLLNTSYIPRLVMTKLGDIKKHIVFKKKISWYLINNQRYDYDSII